MIALLAPVSIALLCGCQSRNDRATIFKLKTECAARKDKFVREGESQSDANYKNYVWSVTYSPSLNTCLVARDEVFTELNADPPHFPHLSGQTIQIEDAFSQRVLWQQKSKEPIDNWDGVLNKKLEELN